jgi:hypothetical protein
MQKETEEDRKATARMTESFFLSCMIFVLVKRGERKTGEKKETEWRCEEKK